MNKIFIALATLTLITFKGFCYDEEKTFSKDVYKVSSVLSGILTNYLSMKFDKIIPFSEGKAKRDMEKMLFSIQNPNKYSQVKEELSLLSNPKIKEIKIFEKENLGIAVVEWEYKRSVPKGTSFEEVKVKRETTYLFKKFGKEWKLISYR